MRTFLTTMTLASALALSSNPALSSGGSAANGTQRQAHQAGSASETAPSHDAKSLQQAEQTLRQAQQQLSGTSQGNQQQALQQVRQAVTEAQKALSTPPAGMPGDAAYRNAKQQLFDVQNALKGDQPDRQQIASQLRQVADALAQLRGTSNQASASTAATNKTGNGQSADQPQAPQLQVQQQPPRVTVQQQPPTVTVQQPPPQVTVQQPRPEVTVQQAQPQVNVQRQGEPQVRVVQGNRDQQQRTGATSATPPAQSGGGGQQAAAANSGLPLARVSNLVGKNVIGANGEEAGEVQNLLIDPSGKARGAVVEWGGFFGIGERQAVVPIEKIQLGAGGSDQARLTMTREQLEALPRYDSDSLNATSSHYGWGSGIRLYR